MSRLTTNEMHCPCCGAASEARYIDFSPLNGEYAIACPDCGLMTDWVNSLEKARSLWERRQHG